MISLLLCCFSLCINWLESGTGSELEERADTSFDRVEAQSVGSHASDHPFLVGEESVLVVWFGAGAFLLDAEGLAEIWWLEVVM